MNEKLSALMDGELDRDTASTVIKSLGADDARREDWDCYHLIGDAMRGDNRGKIATKRDGTAAIFSRLAAEPTVFAPVAIAKGAAAIQSRTRIAVAMAASLVTVSAVGVLAFKQQVSTVAPVQLVQQIAPQPIVTTQPQQVSTQVNDYLAVHRQFANPAGLQAAALRSTESRQPSGQ